MFRRGEEALKKGLSYYQRAIALAPTYASAYSRLADSYIILWNNGYLGPHECVPKARAADLKALEIDESLAEAHTSLAWIFGYYD